MYLIVATDQNRGMGINGKLPWNLPNDLQFFRKITTETKELSKQNAVIMGRKSWESIPEKHRPLKDRRNIVLSRQSDFKAVGAEVFNDLDEAIKAVSKEVEKIFIIGGAEIFQIVINDSRVKGIYLTQIESNYSCDTFFPVIPSRFNKKEILGAESDEGINYKFCLYEG